MSKTIPKTINYLVIEADRSARLQVLRGLMKKPQASLESPSYWISRAFRKAYSLWLTWTYPFASIGRRVSVHPSCDLRRSAVGFMSIGNGVVLERHVRLDVPLIPTKAELAISIGDNCVFGQRATVLAINRVQIEPNSIFAPSVLITDHNHEFADVTLPIRDQGGTRAGTVRIEEGCWIGFGSAIVCSQGELVIGRNSVVGANSLVTRSIPPYSVVTGNPARVVKHFDSAKGEWVLGAGAPVSKS